MVSGFLVHDHDIKRLVIETDGGWLKSEDREYLKYVSMKIFDWD